MTQYTQAMERCKKTRAATCKGKLADPLEQYGKWAYWCAKTKDGWHAKKCDCPKL